MNNKEYQKFAVTKDREDAGYTMLYDENFTPSKGRLINGALGLAGECGEVVDIIKKHTQYNKQLNTSELKEEMGDILWYMAIILEDIGSDFNDVMTLNRDKLQKRYPSIFSEKFALLRLDKK